MQICICTHIACTNTYTHTSSQSAHYHTHTLSYTCTTTHTHDVALSPSLTLSCTHTHRTHSIQGFLNWFFKSFLQCWSCHWEDRSIIQEQYLLRVWRRPATRGLWLNLWYHINAPRHQGRSSCQEHAHQESHVLRFKVVQSSSLCSTPHYIFTLHYTSSHHIYECIHSPNILPLLECNFQWSFEPDLWISTFFGQHTTPPWHVAIVMFWSTCASKMTLLPVSFLNVCPFCVCVMSQ